MSYIGTPPSNAFTSLLKQDFSTSATTGYTLDHAVNNANDIALFINFVRQEPTAGYAASGTTLTLTSATASSDDMYCVYLGQALQTVNPANASVGTAQLADSSVTSAKLASGAVANTPAFFAYQTSNQTIANTTATTVSLDTEAFDTDNAFSSNTFTVPSGKAGKYYFTIGLRKNNFTSSRFNISLVNGSGADVVSIEQGTDSAYGTANGSTIVNLSAGNTLVMKVFHNQGGNQTTLQGIHQVYFGGYKIIE